MLRDQLIGGILESVEGAHHWGPQHRLANHASFAITGVEAESVLIALTWSASPPAAAAPAPAGFNPPQPCAGGDGRPYLAAWRTALSLGRGNTPEDVEYVLERLPQIVAQVKESEPAWEEPALRRRR